MRDGGRPLDTRGRTAVVRGSLILLFASSSFGFFFFLFLPVFLFFLSFSYFLLIFLVLVPLVRCIFRNIIPLPFLHPCFCTFFFFLLSSFVLLSFFLPFSFFFTLFLQPLVGKSREREKAKKS